MTGSAKATQRGKNTSELVKNYEKNTEQLLFSLFPFAHPRRESLAISLILVCGWQRGPQLCSSPHSHSSVPPLAPPHCHSAARRKRWQGWELGVGEWGGVHQGETLPVGSRQFQAIAPCSLGFCLHTRAQRQMTINGYNNVVCFSGCTVTFGFCKLPW